MTKGRKFRVYLAGPISGCNDAQKHEWRDEIKRRYAAHFDFTDPTSDFWGENATPYDTTRPLADRRRGFRNESTFVNLGTGNP